MNPVIAVAIPVRTRPLTRGGRAGSPRSGRCAERSSDGSRSEQRPRPFDPRAELPGTAARNVAMTSRADSARAEHIASVLRERIYGSIACLSTLLVLVRHPGEHVEPWTAVLDVVVATGGLWAASLLSEYVAHLAVREVVAEPLHPARMLRTSGQILQAAVLPVLLLVGSALGRVPFAVATWTSIWFLVATMGVFAVLAVRRTRLPWWKRAVLVLVLIGLGLLVVLLKSAH